jgi:adenylate cyclase
MYDPAFVRMIRLKTFDIYQQISPRLDADYPVYVIDVDEKSLAQVGQWPWPRTIIAELVEKTFEQQAAGMAFDIVFAEPDGLSPENVKQLWNLDDATKDALSRVTPHDITLSRTIQNYPVVAGQVFTFLSEDMGEKEDALEIMPKSPIESTTEHPISDHVQTATGAVRNLAGIEYKAPGLGHFTFVSDVDSIARRVPMIVQYENEIFPSLSLELLRVAMGLEGLTVDVGERGIQQVNVGDYSFPTDSKGNYWVHFRHHNRDRYVSAVDVLNGSLPEGTLAGKLVIVGTSAMGLFDLRSSPLDPILPGVDVHMQVVETILDQDFLYRPEWSKNAEILFVLLIGFLMMMLMEKQTAVKSFVLAAFVIGGTLAGCIWAFITHGFLLDVGLPLIALGVVFTMHNFVKYAKEEAAKKEIRKAFGHYLSPDMVNILTEDADNLSLGGAEKEITVFFSDIRSFTTISEGLSPDELTVFINEYLTPMTDIIMRHKGTIDKYMGDAVMAFWNAPLDIKDHTYHACVSALEQMKVLKELNVGWAERKMPPINIGIGINTGMACVGNMGSTQRFDYTVLGDSVNLAARLESSSKMYGVDIVVSEDVKESIGDKGAFLPIDFVIVKGKTEPIATYALLGLEDAADEMKQSVAIMEGFMKLYRAREWAKAKNKLSELPDTYEVLKKLYKERIASYKKTPPPKDWDGSYTATSK